MSIRRSESVRDELLLFGEWWLPADPDKRLHGVLKGSVATEFTLETHGVFDTALPSIVVHGMVEKGEQVTLLNCRTPGIPPDLFGSGGWTSCSYCVGLIVRGAWIKPEQDILHLQKISFGLHLLEAWHGIQAFDARPIWDYVRTKKKSDAPIYEKPDAVELANHKGHRIGLEYRALLPGWGIGQTSMTIEHGARITIESTDKVTPFFNECSDPSAASYLGLIESLTRFFSFAFGVKTFPYDMVGVVEGTSEGAKEVCVQILLPRSIPESPKDRTQPFMDLQPHDLPGDPKPVIERWLSFGDDMRIASAHYLDVTCASVNYLETQAADLCKALEACHRQTDRKKLALKTRLVKLMNLHPDAVTWLVGDKDEQDLLVAWALEKRNASSHARRAEHEEELDAQTEYDRVQILRGLLYMSILAELGYSASEIAITIKRNQCFIRARNQRISPRNPKIIHVAGRRGHWEVYSQGLGLSQVFRVKNDAIKKGRQMAKKVGGKLIIHKTDGSVEREHGYGRK